MKKTQTFKELVVWQKAHQMVLSIYKISKNYPREELFGLTSQIRRAAISVPANIAEGYTKRGKKDKVRFFNIAQGSLEEVKYYIILSEDLNYYKDDNLSTLADEVGKLINSYIKAILNSGS